MNDCLEIIIVLSLLHFSRGETCASDDKKCIRKLVERNTTTARELDRDRAINFTVNLEETNGLDGLGSSKILGKERSIDDVSMDDDDTSATDSPPTPTSRTCKENGKMYKINESFDRGCDENCTCSESGLICVPKCAKPLYKKGQATSLKDGTCFEKDVPDNSCCVALKCMQTTTTTTNAINDTNGNCTFKNQTYKKGEIFNDGCEFTCECENFKQISCKPRCSHVQNATDNCVGVPDPKDSCCTIFLCDVEERDANKIGLTDGSVTTSTMDNQILSAVALNHTAVLLKFLESSKSDRNCTVEISSNGIEWNRQPCLNNVVAGLTPGKKYHFRNHGVASNTVETVLPQSPDVDEKQVITSCVYKGIARKIGEEFHDKCESFCMCDKNGVVECAPIECPTDFGLDVLDPQCLEWETHPADFVPVAPNCCPDKVHCKDNGSCIYNGQNVPNWSELPAKLTGCEKKCYCEMGNVTCQQICPPVAKTPPKNLPCAHTSAILTHVPGDDCCLFWICSNVGSSELLNANSSSSQNVTEMSKDDAEKATTTPDNVELEQNQYIGPFNPQFTFHKKKPATHSHTSMLSDLLAPFHLDKLVPQIEKDLNETTPSSGDKANIDDIQAFIKQHVRNDSQSHGASEKGILRKKPSDKEIIKSEEIIGKKPLKKHPAAAAETNDPDEEIGEFVHKKHQHGGKKQKPHGTSGEKKPPFGQGHHEEDDYVDYEDDQDSIREHLENFFSVHKGEKPGTNPSPLLPHSGGQDINDYLQKFSHPQRNRPQLHVPAGLAEFSQYPRIPAGYGGNFHHQGYERPELPNIPAVHQGQKANKEEFYGHLPHNNPYEEQQQQHPLDQFYHQHQLDKVFPNVGYDNHESLNTEHATYPILLKQNGISNNSYSVQQGPGLLHQGITHPFGIKEEYDVKMNVLESVNESTVRLVFSIPPYLVGLHGRVELRYTSNMLNTEPSTWEQQILAPPNDLLATSELEFELTNLLPNTTYKIKITVNMRDISNSPTSSILTITTLPGSTTTLAPIITVDPELKAIQVNSTWVKLSWRPFTNNELKFIDGIQLRYKEVEDKIYAATTLIHRAVTTYTLENLKSDSVYEIGIYFIPFPGQATELQAGHPIQIRTAIENDPYKFNVVLDVNRIKATSVEIQWSGIPYPEDKFVNVFRVIYQAEEYNKEEYNSFKMAKRDIPQNILIQDLKPNTRYRLWLEAYLTNGRTRKSNVKDFTTKSGPVMQNTYLGSQGKLDVLPLVESNSYYGPLVGVSIVAVLAVLTVGFLIFLLAKKHGTNKAPITHPINRKPKAISPPATTTAAYDNPSYKTCDTDKSGNNCMKNGGFIPMTVFSNPHTIAENNT